MHAAAYTSPKPQKHYLSILLLRCSCCRWFRFAIARVSQMPTSIIDSSFFVYVAE